MPNSTINIFADERMELSVIGSCLLSEEAREECCEVISSQDFFNLDYATCFSIIESFRKRNVPSDPVAFRNELEKDRNTFQKLGGMAFIASAIDSVGSVKTARYYAEQVKDLSVKREYQKMAYKVIQLLDKESSDGVKNYIDAFLGNVAMADGIVGDKWADVIEAVAEKAESAKDGEEADTGEPTGFRELDKIIQGFRKGTLNILGARPAMGKTTLAMNIAENVAQRGGRVLVFSLEMLSEDLGKRQLAAQSGYSVRDIESGMIGSARDWQNFMDTASSMAREDIVVYAKGVSTVQHIKNELYKNMREKPVSLVVIDYLQLLSLSRDERTGSKYEEITKISRELKKLSLNANIPILCLSQLSRQSEERTDKHPMLSDLRDSGAIEQDADTVLFVHRDAYYDKALKDDSAEIIVAKNRRGGIGTAYLGFVPECTSFYNK